MWLFNQREPHHVFLCKFVFTSVLLSSLKQHMFNCLSTCSKQRLGMRGICVQDKPLWGAVALCVHVCVPICEDTAGDN